MTTTDSQKISRNPFQLLDEIFSAAKARIDPNPLAMILATADARGNPSSRTVLLKHYDEDGFVFYTNRQSRKGRQLEENPRASLTFYLPQLHRQIQVEGTVSPVSDSESDAYWRTRPRESQIGAWASAQSRAIPPDDSFEARLCEFKSRFADESSIPRPRHWGGYRVHATRIEFWSEKAHRLHERLCYQRTDSSWSVSKLFP